MSKKLILASQSPRRREILEKIGIDFDIRVPNTDEKIDLSKPLSQEISRLALEKAKAVQQVEDEIILGADTVVVLNNQVLGKPKNEEDAFRMLKELSGQEHKVLTGVCLIKGSKVWIDCIESLVEFNNLSNEEIKTYILTKEPLDKAGAYGIQGKGGNFIKKINGDYTAIMGLPQEWVYRMVNEVYESEK